MLNFISFYYKVIFMGFLTLLFKIALPIILQNFLSSFVNMLDTVMVGQLGSTDIAAVGLGNQIFWVMSIVLFGIVSGGSIFIAQYWGKKDLDGVCRTMGIILTAAFVVTVLFFCGAFFAPEICISIYSKDPEVIRRGSIYLRWVSPSYLFTGLSIAVGHALRSTERVKLPMVATVVSVILNGTLNFVLIFGIKVGETVVIPSLGIVGAAVATVIARVVECAICLIFPYIRKYEIAVNPVRFFKFQSSFLSKYVKICIPVLLNETLWGVGTSLQNSIFGHAGTSVVAAYNIDSSIFGLVWTFFIGCGNAAAILIGKKIGEGEHKEAISLANRLTAFMIASGAALGLLLWPLSCLLGFLFKVEPEVIHMAKVFLRITAFLFPLWSINMITVVGVCRSGGDTIYALIMDVGFMWVLSLPLGFCAVNFWHLPYWGILLCIQSESIFKSAMGLLRLPGGKWLHDVTV